MSSEENDGRNTLQYFNLGELKCPKEAEELPETNTYQCHIQNHIRGCHVQYNGRLAHLQYLITSYDIGTRPCILQRLIESTIYNDESSKYGSYVRWTQHNLAQLRLYVWT